MCEQGGDSAGHQDKADRPRAFRRRVPEAEPVEHEEARNAEHHRLCVSAKEAHGHPRAQARFEPAQFVRLDFFLVLVLLEIRRMRSACIGGVIGAAPRGELGLVVRKPQPQRHERDHTDQREDDERPGQSHEGQDHQRGQGRADDRTQPEAGGNQRQRLCPLCARRAAGDIGLHRRRGRAAEPAVEAARGGKGHERCRPAQQADQAEPQGQPA